MKVEIWSDVACPFCWIGRHHFEKAVAQMKPENLRVEWRSFELDPSARREYDEDLYSLLAKKYGQPRSWAVESSDQLRAKGEQLGLTFNFDRVVPTNTFDAHRLLHLAKSKGMELEEAMFRAYFQEGKKISDPDTLLMVGVEAGMEKEEIHRLLNSDLFSNEVREDERLSREFGVRGVPFFVVNRKYGISGAQPVEHFIDVLTKAQDDELHEAMDEKQSGETCGVDGC